MDFVSETKKVLSLLFSSLFFKANLVRMRAAAPLCLYNNNTLLALNYKLAYSTKTKIILDLVLCHMYLFKNPFFIQFSCIIPICEIQ